MRIHTIRNTRRDTETLRHRAKEREREHDTYRYDENCGKEKGGREKGTHGEKGRERERDVESERERENEREI